MTGSGAPDKSKQQWSIKKLSVTIVSLRLSAGKALDLNGRVTGYIVEFLALAK